MLRQPGLSLILEGPSGLGKTTLLKHAIEQDKARFGTPAIYSARIPKNVEEISRLTIDGHDGVVAVDDFHRLPEELAVRLIDYMKHLADSGASSSKIIIVGIPDTAQSLVKVSHDIANRIRIFRPKAASDVEVLGLIELGENALNIQFDDKDSIVKAAAGSLITTQSLCWHLAAMAGVEETAQATRPVGTDIRAAVGRVHEELRIKYSDVVNEFVALDDAGTRICEGILAALAWSTDSTVPLGDFRRRNPQFGRAVDEVFIPSVANRIAANPAVSRNIYYDARVRRVIADDPQFIFYLRQLNQ